MAETINIDNMVAINKAASINDDLNVIVLLIGLAITVLFFFLYFKELKSRQLLNYIPNVWTSLGILGTFIVIVTSLGGNAGTLSDVDTLVRNIIPAFTTSIIGIVGAVTSSIVIKIIHAIEDKKEREQYIKEVGGNITPEILLKRILNSIEYNNHSTERFVWASERQEKNIREFLNDFLLQLNTFYDKIFETNKEQVKTLSYEYVHNVNSVLTGANEEIKKRIDTLLLSHSQSVQEYLSAEKTKLDEIADDIKAFLKGIPEDVENMKNELIESLQNTIIEKHNQLLNNNNSFTTQLLETVKAFESELSQNTKTQYLDILEVAQIEIHKIITLLENSLAAQSVSIEHVSTTLSIDMSNIASSITKSSNDYEAIVGQLNRLLPILETQITHSEKSVVAAERNEANQTSVLENLEEIVKKNQQLRYELMQWKRVHKKVKINDMNGTKECPNCQAENPIDANFCRKCTCGFWDYETNK